MIFSNCFFFQLYDDISLTLSVYNDQAIYQFVIVEKLFELIQTNLKENKMVFHFSPYEDL